MARKKGGHAGGHGWFVTFADLMGLLMSFFVMLTAFSTQDQKKLNIVAGSMRDAFGTSKTSKFAGIIEMEGVPTRSQLRNLEKVSPDRASDQTAPRQHQRKEAAASQFAHDRAFALAAASLRQALRELPDIAEKSQVVSVETGPDGLEISLFDQDARSMFGQGSTEPTQRARRVLEAVAAPLSRMPNPLRIAGHASAPPLVGGLDVWRLSAGRALAARDILGKGGVSPARFDSVVGRGDAEPMFPDDPSVPANRRVVITLLPVAPPAPPK